MKTLFTPDKDEERSWCHLSSLLPRGQQPFGVRELRLDNGSARPGIIWPIGHFRRRLRRGFQQPVTIAFYQLATLWKFSAAYSSPSVSFLTTLFGCNVPVLVLSAVPRLSNPRKASHCDSCHCQTPDMLRAKKVTGSVLTTARSSTTNPVWGPQGSHVYPPSLLR